MAATTYKPSDVWLGQAGSPGGIYMPTTKPGGPQKPQDPSKASTTVGPEAVRSTGATAGGASWLQDLATYAGGLFNKPGGILSFNPLATGGLPGQSTGGGNAPVQGSPATETQTALQGQPFSWMAPTAQPSTQPAQSTGGLGGDQNWWWKQLGVAGSPVRPYNG